MTDNKYYAVPYSFDVLDTEILSKKFMSFPTRRGVIIYGAGRLGRIFHDWLEHRKITVTCFCDTDPGKQTESCCGLPVISPQTLLAKYHNELIVIALFSHGNEVQAALRADGIDSERIMMLPSIERKHYIQVPIETVTEKMAMDRGWEVFSPVFLMPMGKHKTGPKVLIYTSVYNIPSYYLRRAIESVLGQTYRNFIYLILDNGSTDGSNKIIREYAHKDARIEVISFTVNSTISRQQACAYTKSILDRIDDSIAYVCSLDNDDYYEADFLEQTVTLSEKHNAEITMAESVVYRMENPAINWKMGSPIGTKVYATPTEIVDMLCKYGIFHSVTWGKLYKREIIIRYLNEYITNDFFNHVQGIGDVFGSWKNFLNCDKVVLADSVLHYWTRRPKSLSFLLGRESAVVERWLHMYRLMTELLHQTQRKDSSHWDSAKHFLRMAFGEDVDLLINAHHTDPESALHKLQQILRNPLVKSLKGDSEFRGRIQILEDMMVQLKMGNQS